MRGSPSTNCVSAIFGGFYHGIVSCLVKHHGSSNQHYYCRRSSAPMSSYPCSVCYWMEWVSSSLMFWLELAQDLGYPCHRCRQTHLQHIRCPRRSCDARLRLELILFILSFVLRFLDHFYSEYLFSNFEMFSRLLLIFYLALLNQLVIFFLIHAIDFSYFLRSCLIFDEEYRRRWCHFTLVPSF